MKLNAQSHSSLLSVIKKALRRYVSTEEKNLITDIHLQPNPETGELVIFNDDEEILAHAVVQDWVDYKEDDFYQRVESLLRNELIQLREDGLFNNVKLMPPYSLVLVDEDKETVAELLLIDDEETLFVDNELLKGLDEELNAFLKDLLEK